MGAHHLRWDRGAGAFLLGLERRLRAGLSEIKRARRRGVLPGPAAIDLLMLWVHAPREHLDDRELELVAWARSVLPAFNLKPTLRKCVPRALGLRKVEGERCR